MARGLGPPGPYPGQHVAADFRAGRTPEAATPARASSRPPAEHRPPPTSATRPRSGSAADGRARHAAVSVRHQSPEGPAFQWGWRKLESTGRGAVKAKSCTYIQKGLSAAPTPTPVPRSRTVPRASARGLLQGLEHRQCRRLHAAHAPHQSSGRRRPPVARRPVPEGRCARRELSNVPAEKTPVRRITDPVGSPRSTAKDSLRPGRPSCQQAPTDGSAARCSFRFRRAPPTRSRERCHVPFVPTGEPPFGSPLGSAASPGG